MQAPIDVFVVCVSRLSVRLHRLRRVHESMCQSDFRTILLFIHICWQNRLHEKVIYFVIKTEIDCQRFARDYYFSEVHLHRSFSKQHTSPNWEVNRVYASYTHIPGTGAHWTRTIDETTSCEQITRSNLWIQVDGQWIYLNMHATVTREDLRLQHRNPLSLHPNSIHSCCSRNRRKLIKENWINSILLCIMAADGCFVFIIIIEFMFWHSFAVVDANLTRYWINQAIISNLVRVCIFFLSFPFASSLPFSMASDESVHFLLLVCIHHLNCARPFVRASGWFVQPARIPCTLQVWPKIPMFCVGCRVSIRIV